MPYNARDAFSSALSLFSSLYEDMNPADLPEGLSPDCQDVWFLPGSVSTRPALSEYLGSAVGGAPQILSVEDFPVPSGVHVGIFADDTGAVWQRNGDGTKTQLTTLNGAGIQFKAENAFTKQFYGYYNATLAAAFSDTPFVGVDIPRYFDGTDFWRVTQDAPGAPPTINPVVVAPATLQAPGAPLTYAIAAGPTGATEPITGLTITSIAESGFVCTIRTPNGANIQGLQVGDPLHVAGVPVGGYNGTFVVSNIQIVPGFPSPHYLISYVNSVSGLGASAGGTYGSTIAQFTTTSPNAFNIGDSVTVAGVGVGGYNGTWVVRDVLSSSVFLVAVASLALAGSGGGTATEASSSSSLFRQGNIVTAYTAAAHGFSAGWQVRISAVANTVLGTSISAISRDGNGVVTVTTASGHGLIVGATVVINGVTNPDTTYNGTFTVASVLNSTQFTYEQAGSVSASGAGTGHVQDQWNGTYIILSTPSNTSFTYFQLGANDSTAGSGTATIIPLMAAGPRAAVLMFKSKNGAITGPSIPVNFTSDGANLLGLTNILIGPPGTAQRIIAFTPASGANFYYLTRAIVPGGATAPLFQAGTIINDNITTSVVLDFSDTQLTGGTQIDITGNDLFAQVVLAPCLGVVEYQGRLAWWGEINNIKNFVNMGFDGGYLPSVNLPAGWSTAGSTGGSGTLFSSNTMGFSYQMTSAGGLQDALISQTAYQDYYGAPILQNFKQYICRVLLQAVSPGIAGNLVVAITSASTGLNATCSFPVASLTASGAWYTLAFPTLPDIVPSDAVLSVYLASATNGAVIQVDELEIIDAAQPVLGQQLRTSYFNNEFGYDQDTGIIGLASYTAGQVTACFEQRGVLYALTDQSHGDMIRIQNNGSTEPFQWPVDRFAQQVDCVGPSAVDTAEGVAWWAGQSGLRIFAGDQPKKLSQERQPTWNRINWEATLKLWVRNDPIQRMLYVGLPLDGANAVSEVEPMSYRSVNMALEPADPLHISYSGKLICSDLCRKWTRWSLPLNCGAMLTNNGTSQIVFGAGFGQLYSLDFAKFSDDGYGVISSYYTTYFHWNHEMEQGVPLLGLHRKLYAYLSIYVTGIGNLSITPLVDSLNNPWQPKTSVFNPVSGLWQSGPVAASRTEQLSSQLDHDLDWRLNVLGDRVAFKIAVTPLPGTADAYMNLQHLVVSGRMDRVMPVRGAFL